MMLAQPKEVGVMGGCCGMGEMQLQLAETSCSRLQTLTMLPPSGLNFQSGFHQRVFLCLTMKNIQNRDKRPEPQTQNPAKS